MAEIKVLCLRRMCRYNDGRERCTLSYIVIGENSGACENYTHR